MSKAGGIIGIIAGIFGFIAAIVTLFVGGLGSAFEADGANTVVSLGWGGVLFSFLAIIFGAVVIARPKGAGIGLIIVSILGAILGGTLVAIAMALSLIGGILAVVGANNVQSASSAMPTIIETTKITTEEKTSAWLWVVAGAGVLVIGLVLIGGKTTDKPKEDALVELANAQPSTLHAEGELSELFALGSKNTDLQRENKLNEIKGKIVQWQLPVYEVSRSGDLYRVQTRTRIRVGPLGHDLVGTFVYITPRDDAERQTIEALKTDDLILFKGRISGSSLRSLEIKPALLVVQSATAPQVAEAPTATELANTSALAEDEQILDAIYGTTQLRQEMKVFEKHQVATGAGQRLFVLVAAKTPVGDCYACAPKMGVAMFSKAGGALQLEAAMPYLDTLGSWGRPEKAEPVQVGPTRHGLIFHLAGGRGGYWTERWILVVPHQNSFVRLDVDDTAGNNDGTCNRKADDPIRPTDKEEDIRVCYEYASTLKFTRGRNAEYDDIVVATTGSDRGPTNDTIIPVNRSRTFVFDGQKYILQSSNR